MLCLVSSTLRKWPLLLVDLFLGIVPQLVLQSIVHKDVRKLYINVALAPRDQEEPIHLLDRVHFMSLPYTRFQLDDGFLDGNYEGRVYLLIPIVLDLDEHFAEALIVLLVAYLLYLIA